MCASLYTVMVVRGILCRPVCYSKDVCCRLHAVLGRRQWSALVCTVQGRCESCCDCRRGSGAAFGAVCWSQRYCVKECCLSNRIDDRANKDPSNKFLCKPRRHSDIIVCAVGVLEEALAQRTLLVAASNYCLRGCTVYITPAALAQSTTMVLAARLGHSCDKSAPGRNISSHGP